MKFKFKSRVVTRKKQLLKTADCGNGCSNCGCSGGCRCSDR